MVEVHYIPKRYDTFDKIVIIDNRQGIESVAGKFLFRFVDGVAFMEGDDLSGHDLLQVCFRFGQKKLGEADHSLEAIVMAYNI